MREFVEAECERHGLDRHLYIHEAGHAVAAIDQRIPFGQVTIYDENGGPQFGDDLFHAAAAIEMLSNDPTTWVPTDSVASLRFILAGAMTETALLGHAIEDGYKEEFNLWRRGLRKTDAMTPSELDQQAGGNFLAELDRVEGWARENSERIKRLAARLAELTRPGCISYEDVVTLLDER